MTTNLDDLVIDDLVADDLVVDDLTADDIVATPGWDDLRVYASTSVVGAIAPTDEVGFRGNNAFKVRNFVHTQADEIQFPFQMPHHWKEGTGIFPHVHFSPWTTNAGAAAGKFVFEFYIAKPFEAFPADVVQYAVTYGWTGGKQWAHLIASNAVALSMTGKTISAIGVCRMYRDNTVQDNFAGKLTVHYVDFHYQIDRPYGSRQEYVK